MSPVLEVRDVGVDYGRISAVRDVSFTVDATSIVTVIGPNGAGKTTLLKALMGLLPCRGEIRFMGEPMTGLGVEERAERGLLLVPETRELFGSMTVADNLLLGGYMHRYERAANASDLDRVYALFPRLQERRAQTASTLSGGERQMLAVGRALMGRPKLLMLDEPSLGLAPLIIAEIFRIIVQLREIGTSILLVEQNARAALKAADYGFVLEIGDIVHHGPAAALLADPRLSAIYLGGHPAEELVSPGSST